MAPPLKDTNPASEKERVAQLEAELAAAKKQLEAVGIASKPKPAVVKGTKTYRLTQPHYRKGVLYQPGELITVTDEAPGASWQPVEAKAVVQHVAVEKPSMRASDQQV